MAGLDHVHLLIKNNRSGEPIFRITPDLLAGARSRHPDVAAHVTATLDWDTDNFDELIGAAHAIVTWDLPTQGLASRAPNLRWIHIIGAGVEHLVPLTWLPDRVTLTNNRGVHADKAGQYGLMALLMLNNRLPSFVAAQRRHDYIELFTSTIVDKVLLVVGTGHMGTAVAAQAQSLGLRTIGIWRNPKPTEGFDEIGGPDDLDDFLPRADFVVVTTPLTTETLGLIDARRLGLMKPTAGLINMGRAQVVDYDALAKSLSEGAIAGAVLDVFDPEPLPADSPLWDVPNLILTPHTSSDDLVRYTPLTLDLIFENLRRLLADEALLNAVDPKLGY